MSTQSDDLPRAPTPTAPPMLTKALNGNSPQQSAMNNGNLATEKHSAMLKSAGGKRRRNRRGGANETVIAPKMPYTGPSAVADSQSNQGLATGTVKANVSNTQSASYDHCMGQGPACTLAASQAQAGGKRSSKKWGRMSGGKSHSVNWGCMSGGKKRRTKKSRKSKKQRKSKNYRKSKK